MRENPTDPRLVSYRPQLRRAVYTIGLFFRYFDFTVADVYGDYPVSDLINILCSMNSTFVLLEYFLDSYIRRILFDKYLANYYFSSMGFVRICNISLCRPLGTFACGTTTLCLGMI